MNLIKLEERELKHWGKAPVGKELHIREPNEFELEQAIARAKINDIDTIVVYK